MCTNILYSILYYTCIVLYFGMLVLVSQPQWCCSVKVDGGGPQCFSIWLRPSGPGCGATEVAGNRLSSPLSSVTPRWSWFISEARGDAESELINPPSSGDSTAGAGWEEGEGRGLAINYTWRKGEQRSGEGENGRRGGAKRAKQRISGGEEEERGAELNVHKRCEEERRAL